MRNFFVQNFGCRATQADGAALEALLSDKGLVPVAQRDLADLVVLNTCTVTAAADSDVRQTVRRVHRENAAARILVTGCYAQRAPEELAAMPGVEWVVGNSHKTQIAELVTGLDYHGQIHVGDIFAEHDFLSVPTSKFRTVATIAARSVSFPTCGAGAAARRWTRCWSRWAILAGGIARSF